MSLYSFSWEQLTLGEKFIAKGGHSCNTWDGILKFYHFCVKMHFCQEVFPVLVYMKWICCQEILNVKSPVPTFHSFPKPISLRPTKMFISCKSGSFSDFEFSLREIFITDGSDSVHALEFYHLFSRGYEAPILRFVLRNLCRQIGPASPACWWQGRLVWLDKSKSLIYTGGHDSYRSV